MKGRMKKILLAATSSVLFVASIFGFSSCNPSVTDDSQKPYGLVSDFENYDEISKFTFEWYFGAASINTDPQYITNGSGSMKVTDTKKTATLTIPLSGQFASADYSDTSKLQSVELDLYNDSDEIYTMFVGLQYKDGMVSSEKQTIALQPKQWTEFVWNVDLKSISVNADVTEASGFLINFEKNSDKTVYVDRLQFKYSQEKLPVYEVALDEGELCSFEKEYQEYALYSGVYGTSTDYWPETAINTDTQYVKEGEKSLKMVAPAGVKGRYPYIAFALRVLEKANWAQYGNEAALSFWVYNAQDKNFLLNLDFFRRGSTVQRGFTHLLAPGWTNVILTFPEINKQDGGVDLLTSSLQEFRLVYESFAETETLKEKVLYFDDFKILKGSEVYEDLVKPTENDLIDFDNETSRESIGEDLAKYFTLNRGEMTIANEEGTDNYALKLGLYKDGEPLTDAQKTWVSLKFNVLSRMIEYLQLQDEYADINTITFKIKTDGLIGVCLYEGYYAFGSIIQKESVYASEGWVTITVPISAILNSELQLYASGATTELYIDEIKAHTIYTITWKNADDTVLAQDQVYKGEMPAYTGVTPAIESANPDKTMRFIGWDKEIVEATRNITYVAVYQEVDLEYLVTFDTDGGNSIEPIYVKKGNSIDEMPIPYKQGSEFSRWSMDLTGVAITQDITVVAVWKEVDITDQFTWIDGKAYYANAKGTYASGNFGIPIATEGNFKYSQFVDVSKYVGRTLQITMPKATNYGLLFEDGTSLGYGASSGTKMDEGWWMLQNDTAEGRVMTIVIPEGAKRLKTTYYKDETGMIPFSAKILDAYEITFDTKGGTEIPTQMVYYGEYVQIPNNPTLANATFQGWDVDLTQPITKPIKATAIYKYSLAEVDITDQFIWQRTNSGYPNNTNAGIYINYANSSSAYGIVYGTNGNYGYTKNYIDVSAYVGRTLRITLPDTKSYGLVFADETATGVGAQTGTKYETGWYAYQNDGTGDGKYVDIVIPEGAKYLKATYYWDTTGKTPFSAKILAE